MDEAVLQPQTAVLLLPRVRISHAARSVHSVLLSEYTAYWDFDTWTDLMSVCSHTGGHAAEDCSVYV